MYTNFQDAAYSIIEVPGQSPGAGLVVEYCQARCGAGKTSAALWEMATSSERWIYAVDRKAVIEERIAAIRAYAAGAGGLAPHVEVVHSGENNRAGEPIEGRIRKTLEQLDNARHAIVIITHAGLRMTSRETYRAGRWGLVIDEAPDWVEVLSMDSGPLLVPFFAAYFDLDDGVIAARRPMASREFERPALAGLRSFHDITRTGGAVALQQASKSDQAAMVPLTCWGETSEAPWAVLRSWDTHVLNVFNSVQILADSFPDTITYHALRSSGVQLRERVLADARMWCTRPVTIEYFADDHSASAHQWQKPDTAIQMARIAAYLADAVTCDEHLWTISQRLEGHFAAAGIQGQQVSPKQAGENQWGTWHQATMIYTAKLSPHEIGVLSSIGMSADDAVRAREGLDIRQFAMRTSLRDPHSMVPVTLRLYDLQQAEALKAYLDEGYGFACTLRKIEIGVTKSPSTKARKLQTREERQESRRRTQAQNYQRRKDKQVKSI